MSGLLNNCDNIPASQSCCFGNNTFNNINGIFTCRKIDEQIYNNILYNFQECEIFLDSHLNLVKLSLIVGTNTTYLSNVINKYFGCNVRTLINKYRIEYAKKLLQQNRQIYNELAKKCGFRSKSVFYSAFQKEVGISPAKYYNNVCEPNSN